MCIIVALPPFNEVKNELTKENYLFMWESNPHGGGFSYVEDNNVIIKKGYMEFKHFYRAFREKRKLFPNSNFLVHLRYNTVGKTEESNCHPFRVHEMAMAHNGTIRGVKPKDGKSDSCLFAELLNTLPKNFIFNYGYNQLITDFIVKNRIVFLTPANKFIFINKQEGEILDDIWFSNDFFKYKRAVTNNVYGNYKGYNRTNTTVIVKDDEEVEKCEWCKLELVCDFEKKMHMCTNCYEQEQLYLNSGAWNGN